MKKHFKIWLGVAAAVALVGVTAWYLSRHSIDVLQPAGDIARKERNLILWCAVLSGTVVFPVFGLLFFFAWKYREGNKRASYHPDQEGSKVAETIWWLIPTVLLVVISTITWRSSYALDPFKPLQSDKQPLKIQVVALDWKWLFIYPQQNIATVNYAMIPVDRPVEFDITSDTVMSSFWVPKLGGQMYAMPGMVTKLHLNATQTGTYNGSSANIGGKGFADMRFKVMAVEQDHFDFMMRTANPKTAQALDASSYARLATPGTDDTISTYRYDSVDPDLYHNIVMKYMMPMHDHGALPTGVKALEGVTF